MNLIELLLGGLTQEASVKNIAKKSGGSNKQILKLIAIALPILISYMTKNASSKDGAQSLLGALGQHKDTKDLAAQVAEADTEDGAKILGHILGADEELVTKDLAKQTGMDPAQVLTALSSMAPGVLSGLSAATSTAGKSKKAGVNLADGIDLSDVMGLMGSAAGAKGGIDLADGIGLDDVAGIMGMFSGKKSAASPMGGFEDILGGILGGGQVQTSSKKSAMDGSDLLNMLAGMM